MLYQAMETFSMVKLIITVEKNTEIAKKILKGWQYFAYKRSMDSLYKILYARIKKYQVKSEDKKAIFTEEGDKEYIQLRKREWENFMFAESTELNSEKFKQYQKHINDRWIQKVARGAHKLKDSIKNKAIRAALGGTDVLSFFSKIGIFITWKVEK